MFLSSFIRGEEKENNTIIHPCLHGGLCFECTIKMLDNSGDCCHYCRGKVNKIYKINPRMSHDEIYEIVGFYVIIFENNEENKSEEEEGEMNQEMEMLEAPIPPSRPNESIHPRQIQGMDQTNFIQPDESHPPLNIYQTTSIRTHPLHPRLPSNPTHLSAN